MTTKSTGGCRVNHLFNYFFIKRKSNFLFTKSSITTQSLLQAISRHFIVFESLVNLDSAYNVSSINKKGLPVSPAEIFEAC